MQTVVLPIDFGCGSLYFVSFIEVCGAVFPTRRKPVFTTGYNEKKGLIVFRRWYSSNSFLNVARVLASLSIFSIISLNVWRIIV